MKGTNKLIQRIAKNTIGSKVDSVTDFVDLLAQIISEYFNQKYKISKKIEEVRQGILNTLYAFKRAVVRSVIEIVLIITGLLALIGGILLLLTRYVPLEYVLIGYGFLVLIIISFMMKLKE